MRSLKSVSGVFLACLLLAATALAANKGSLEVFSPFQVNGKQLKAGQYSLRWEGNGPEVQLSIVQSGKVVASTPAQVVTMDHSPSGSSAVLTTNPDGSQSLSQIRFGGKKYALQIGDAASANGGGSSSGSSTVK